MKVSFVPFAFEDPVLRFFPRYGGSRLFIDSHVPFSTHGEGLYRLLSETETSRYKHQFEGKKN